ncbi:MAG: Glu-tRNA(Gln) amidotransferase subunit GatE [Candidatus Hadarchaeales archaeon]
MERDYSKLGLKVGLEIHQELDTNKLFCRCPSVLREEKAPLEVRRRLHVSQSELGEVDRAALLEVSKEREFRYQVYPDTTCLVELDEEPPHPLNEEALEVALTLSLMLEAKPVDEIYVMRKIVVDGSNTSGFQRTALIATDGKIRTEKGVFRLPTICLEEDAARKVGEGEGYVEYRLDRLGIPLLEVATAPEFSDPKTPAEVALRLGMLMRATGKVKRGLGTIRQDLNISISGGARQEIKGIQELELIPIVIEREVQRQLSLLEIREELRRRGAGGVERKFLDVTRLFEKTGSQLVRRALEKGEKVMALKLPGFSGLLGKEIQPGRRLGTELSDRARVEGGVGGILHTDELPVYGISVEVVESLRKVVGAGEGDAVVMVMGPEERCRKALEAVAKRAEEAKEGVPAETRRALPDGNTEFMRPLPGAERMYPETDIPPIPITPEKLASLRLPEPPEKTKERLRGYGLSGETADRLLYSGMVETFERLVRESGAPPKLVAFTLLETMVSLRREGRRVERIGEEFLLEAFRKVASGEIAKEALPELLKLAAEGKEVGEAIRELGLERVGEEELRAKVEEVVSSHLELVRERGEGAVRPLMGILMKYFRGKVDGKVVNELLTREVKRRLGECVES